MKKLIIILMFCFLFTGAKQESVTIPYVDESIFLYDFDLLDGIDFTDDQVKALIPLVKAHGGMYSVLENYNEYLLKMDGQKVKIKLEDNTEKILKTLNSN
jgi:hypothetical protein